jgi:hypothetical protein
VQTDANLESMLWGALVGCWRAVNPCFCTLYAMLCNAVHKLPSNAPRWTRTINPLIKSQLLCQLS